MFASLSLQSILALGLTTTILARPHQPQTHPRAHAPAVDKRATTTWSYVGCVTDGSARALTGPTNIASTMTVESCQSTCQTAGYVYAGLESSNQCYCGNTISNGQGTVVDNSYCSDACSGEKTESCGGYWKLSLYTSKTTTAGYTSIGCFTDSSSSRVLAGVEVESTTLMTPQYCANYCYGKGYLYAGVEYSKQCYCGNTYNSALAADSSTCNYACTGDKSQTCGGYNKMTLLSLSGNVAGTTMSTSKASTTATSTSTSKASTTTTTKAATTTTKASTTTSSTTTKASTTSTTTKAATSTSTSTNTTKGTTTTAAATTTITSTIAASASTVGVASPPSATGTKYLYAHHMVGNTYSYTQDTWADDISQASAAGIDGFALNYGSDSWQPARLASAYAAAAAQGSFKLFLSMDVSSLGCSSTTDLTNLVNTVSTYANNTAQAKYNGSTLLSTFSGADCTFGYSSSTAGWTAFRTALTTKGVKAYFIPAIFSDISTFSSDTWMEGEFNWNSAWPMGDTPLDTSSDTSYMAALGNKTYMAAMSPAFFTYYGPNSYNKDWIYRSDDWLLARRFEQLIAMRSKLDLVELISWNDYGESHYIGPIRTDQPNSQGWTNGMPHTAWLDIVTYYAQAWKKGTYPTAADQLVLWSRPHPKAATPSAPTNARPTYWDYTDDNLYVWVALKSAATVTITSGTKSASFSLPSGVSKLSVNSSPGSITAKIVRSSATVKSYDSTGTFTYVATPTDYNYNYFVASV